MKTKEFPRFRREIPIEECGEPLVAIPDDGSFGFFLPHPYVSVGAPYGDSSPFFLRASVVEALKNANTKLSISHPGHRLKIFDGYRPLEVQYFMVEYTANEYGMKSYGIPFGQIEWAIQKSCLAYAYQIFATPDEDPTNPPPHTTGAVVDLTIEDGNGNLLPMGSMIDEHEGQMPNHFEKSEDEEWQAFHENRELLRRTMAEAGFTRLEHEWWHFSMGDQYAEHMRALAIYEKTGKIDIRPARYGRYSLLKD